MVGNYPEDTLWNWLGRKIPWHQSISALKSRYGVSEGRIPVAEADSPLPQFMGQPYAFFSDELPAQFPPVKWGCDLLTNQWDAVRTELQKSLGFGRDLSSSVGGMHWRWSFALAALDLVQIAGVARLEIDPGYRRELSDREFSQIDSVKQTALWFPRKREDEIRYTGGFFEITPTTNYVDFLRRSVIATKDDEIRFGTPSEHDVLIGLAGYEALLVPLVGIENLQLQRTQMGGIETHTLSVHFRPHRPPCLLLRSTLEDLSAVSDQLAKLIGRPLTQVSS
jgi:hypothetical protein